MCNLVLLQCLLFEFHLSSKGVNIIMINDQCVPNLIARPVPDPVRQGPVLFDLFCKFLFNF